MFVGPERETLPSPPTASRRDVLILLRRERDSRAGQCRGGGLCVTWSWEAEAAPRCQGPYLGGVSLATATNKVYLQAEGGAEAIAAIEFENAARRGRARITQTNQRKRLRVAHGSRDSRETSAHERAQHPKHNVCS